MTRILAAAAVAAVLFAPSAFAQSQSGTDNRAGSNGPGTRTETGALGQTGTGAQGQSRTATQGQAGGRTETGTANSAIPGGVLGQTGIQGQGQAGAPSQGTTGTGAVNDSLFAYAAAVGGMTELMVSQLGVRKATDPELKRFSQQMIDEHTRMNAELMSMARQKGIALPRELDYRAQFCAQSLAGLSGEKFDKCYAKAQLVIHMESMGTFEAEAERGQDPDVKALASKAVTHIKQHLKEIKPIAMRYEKEEHQSQSGVGQAPERPVR